MKKTILAFACLLAVSSNAQSFQLGFATGIMANYPATTQNLSPKDIVYAKNTNVLTGLFARYDTKTRWAVSINASMYNKSVYNSGIMQEPGIYVLRSYTSDCSFYLLDFSLQYNLNGKSALKDKSFKGVKSYVGVTYTAIQNRRYIHGTEYDAIVNYNTNVSQIYKTQYRAIGLCYYASYNLNKRFAVSLNITGRINTEDFKPISKIDYNELDPDYYLNAAFGIAYRITR